MRLLTLKLVNWGPYVGDQTMKLDTEREAPVVLVHGENMRGKTSLMRAIRWALYGQAVGPDGRVIPPGDFANYDARDSGEAFVFGSELEFEYQDRRMVISRMMQGRGRRGLREAAVEITPEPPMMRVIGGNPVPERDIDEMVQRILHPDISEFFLFDGEMLARFEERLRGESSSAFIRQRIEMALGIPALRQIRTDVTYLLEQTRSAVRRASKAEHQTEALGRQLGKLEDDIARRERDASLLRVAASEAAGLVSSMDRELEKVEGIKEAYYKRRAAEAALAEYRRDRDGFLDELRARLDQCWWLPLGRSLAQMSAEAQDQVRDAAVAIRTRSALDADLRALERQANDSYCLVCGQPIPDERVAPLKRRAEESRRRLADLPREPDMLALSERARSLMTFHSAGAVLDQILGLEKDARRAALRAASEEALVENLTQRIEGGDVDIAALEKSRQDALLTEREAREHIGSVEQELAVLKRQQAETTRQLANASPGGAAYRSQLLVLEDLTASIGLAVDGFSDSMRRTVEKEASRIFRTLTTEPDYAGLRIDGSYYLNIVDERDRVITRRSAGADQIVTMSLIGALAKCAVEEGPVVMDTPFGRLDRGHRKRVLQWVAALAGQAILFVQSGEFERDHDLGSLNGRVGREYILRRLGASSSRIETINE